MTDRFGGCAPAVTFMLSQKSVPSKIGFALLLVELFASDAISTNGPHNIDPPEIIGDVNCNRVRYVCFIENAFSICTYNLDRE